MEADALIGREIAGYVIETLIARGGMSRVYLAQQLSPHRRVALKVLAQDLAGDEAFRTRFLHEGTHAASLEHPNLLPIYSVGEAAGSLFIAMRYVEGPHLGALLLRDGPLAPERTLAFLIQAASALDFAHQAGLVHRDVKPANLLLAGEHLYLADFGVAKSAAARHDLTRTGVFVGTLDYAAPEQIRNEELDGAADIYALGCVLFQCLTGRVPFDRQSEYALMQAHLAEPPPRPSEHGLPVALDQVIATALSKDPDERYRSGRHLVEAARAALEGRAVPSAVRPTVATPIAAVVPTVIKRAPTTTSAEPPPGDPRSPRLPRFRILAGAAIAILVVGALVTGVTPPPQPTSSPTLAVVASPSSTLSATPTASPTAAPSPTPTPTPLPIKPSSTVPVGSAPNGVAVNTTTNRVYVANYGSNTVSVIDGGTNQVTATVALGSAPYHVAVNTTTNRVYVANYGSNTVSVIDGGTNQVTATVAVGSAPYHVAVNTTNSRVYVANIGSNSISVIDGGTNRVTVTVALALGSAPYHVAVNTTTNRVYVANFGSNTVSVIDGGTNQVTATVAVGSGPEGVAVNTTTNRVYVANYGSNTVSVIDGGTNRVTATMAVGSTPSGVAVNTTNNRVYVANIGSNSISVIDGGTNQVTATVAVGSAPYHVAVNTTTNRVYVAHYRSNTVSVLQ